MTGFYMKCNTRLKRVNDITNPCSNRKLMSLIYHEVNNLPKELSNVHFFFGIPKFIKKNTGQTN